MDFEEKLCSEILDKFEPHKRDCWKLIESYKRLGLDDRAAKVASCGTDLTFRAPEDLSDSAKLYRANFCKDRLCWMCSWRRTKKIFGQVSQVMDKLQADHSYRYVFVTLTIRSCNGERLSSELTALSKAFNLFNKRSRIKKAFKGAFRTYEITYHPEHPSSLQFHPHIHIIYAVNKTYFRSSSYIDHDELQAIWRECAGLNYDPLVDIRVVRPTESENGDIDLGGAVAEVATYSVKPSQLFENTDDDIDHAVWVLSSALAGRRMCSFTGVFKKVAAELELDDINDGDLVNTDNEKLRTDVRHILIHYKWQVGYGYERTFITYEKEDNPCT